MQYYDALEVVKEGVRNALHRIIGKA